jgi:omega-hydroxy-beta-dihydromenaquinone-9 sulfotransferase
MSPRAWWNLLRLGHFSIHPSRLGMAIAVTVATPVNAILGWLQKAFWGRRLKESSFHGPPIFIIGHWRSGTTLLHELLVLDERLSSPSTFQCFAPHHFLVSEWFFRKFCGWLLPNRRPMDNMAAGWDRPQEDEFALVNLGLPSPYRRIAFPNQPPPDIEYLNTESLSDSERERWGEGLERFLKSVSYRTERPIVVKSPTHTGRVATLAKIFPNAKFIHITRDPRALFPSTVRLWHSLDQVQGLQVPSGEGVEPYVIQCLQVMYDAFHRQRDSIAPGNLIDIRYEDLVKDPVGQIEQIYRTLRLGDFAHVRETLQEWCDTSHREYQTNRHELPPDQESLIRENWSEYFERYGY